MTVGVNVNSTRALPSGESMRTLLIGALSVILAGCSCLNSPQAMLEGCISKGCFYRTAASPPVELKPAPFKPNPSKAKKKPKKVAKTTTPSSAKSGNGAGPTKKTLPGHSETCGSAAWSARRNVGPRPKKNRACNAGENGGCGAGSAL